MSRDEQEEDVVSMAGGRKKKEDSGECNFFIYDSMTFIEIYSIHVNLKYVHESKHHE